MSRSGGKIGSSQIIDGSIVSADIAALTITDANIAVAGVHGNRLQDGTVNGAKLVDGAVSTLKLLQNAVTAIYATTATTASPTTTFPAASSVMPEMAITQNFSGAPILLLFSAEVFHSNAGGTGVYDVHYEGGMIMRRGFVGPVANGSVITTFFLVHVPAAGTRTYDIRWWAASAGTFTSPNLFRQAIVLELKR